MKILSIASALALTCAFSVSAAKPVSVPRDTSFTAYSTDKKIRKYHPEAVLAKPELPKGCKGL